jgi:RNA polymerase sigma factor (sigma-70 family)
MERTAKSHWIETALERYQSHLIRYASWILGDIERAREVVQDTFLRLCKQNPAQLDGHLPQWLFTVCRNLAFDVRKKEIRMTPLDGAESVTQPQAAPLALASVEHKETMGQVLRVLETLPKKQREVIYLKFQCDLSYKEISEVTNLSVSNIGFLIHTAINSIRKQLLNSPETIRRTP